MSSAKIIELHNVSKQYPHPSGQAFTALDRVSLSINSGELATIVGKSGSGKSTLLNLIAGLDKPTTGEVRVAGRAIHALGENDLAAWRGKNVGVVFQFFQLLPTLTVLENILLAMDFVGAVPRAARKERAEGLLGLVGIADQAHKLPSTLSGGQQQRAAIARALANDPPLLLADEPTGNLDTKTANSVVELFDELVQGGKSVVVVTHDAELASRARRTLRLADGRVAGDGAFSAGGEVR